MTPDLIAYYSQGTTVGGEWLGIFLLVIAIRDAIRKGIALRKAGTRKHIVRFVALFVLNTAGILPIIYLVWYTKKDKFEKQAEQSISKAVKNIEKTAENAIEEAEESIEHTIKKVEKLIKKAPIIGKKSK